MIKKQTFIMLAAICIMLVFATSASANSTISIGDGSGHVTIPIVVTSQDNVGSMDVTLEYDPSIATITDATKCDMDGIVANLENVSDGWIRIIGYQTSDTNLTGAFVLADVSFEPVVDTGSCSLNITVTTFKDLTPAGNSINYTVGNGIYTAESIEEQDESDDGYKWYIHDEDGSEDNITDDEPSENVTNAETPVPSQTKNLPGDDTGDGTDEGSNTIWISIGIGIIAIAIAIYYMTKNNGGE